MSEPSQSMATSSPSAPILIMAGGTGGHVMPGLAVAQALIDAGRNVHWLGASGGMEARLVPERGLPFTGLPVAGLRGKGLVQQWRALWRLWAAFRGARRLLRQLRPSCVISFGGFASGPGGLAAALARIPLVVHEQNSVAGLTNRVLARFARQVLSAFDQVLPRARRVGNPVRGEIEALGERVEPARASGPLRLLVIGGSQGARALNELLPKTLAMVPEHLRPEVVHQCGKNDEESTRQAYARLGVTAQVVPFIADMASAYGHSDLLVCRAGALTIAELCAVGRSAVFVPFPLAVDDHQTRNARWLIERGAGQLLPQSEATPERLSEILKPYLTEPQRARAEGQRNRALHTPSAAKQIAELVLGCALRPEEQAR